MPKNKNKKSNKKNNLKMRKNNSQVAIKRKIRYPFETNIQSFGPGETNLNITGIFTLDMSTYQGFAYLNNQSILLNDEFLNTMKNYNYYKLMMVGVTVYPNDSMNNIPCYINMQWGDIKVDSNTIKLSDSTKIIYNDSKVVKTYFFRPPNAQILNVTGDRYSNPSQYYYYSINSTNTILGTIMVQQDESDDPDADNKIKIRIDWRIRFKNAITEPGGAKAPPMKFQSFENDLLKLEIKKEGNMFKNNFEVEKAPYEYIQSEPKSKKTKKFYKHVKTKIPEDEKEQDGSV